MDVVSTPTPEALAVIYLRALDEVAREIQRTHPNQASRLRMSRMMLDGAFRKLSPPSAEVIKFPRPVPTDLNLQRDIGEPVAAFLARHEPACGVQVDDEPDLAG